ncbi:hypothetical protein [Paraburkholderia tropica]|uniref:hypothetical protein n=1 Tax=Paraburkholderia tropica TaxID=92647 RepID=UPI000B23E206|nr:hypothetical protein [Paraburkholderia tropica]
MGRAEPVPRRDARLRYAWVGSRPEAVARHRIYDRQQSPELGIGPFPRIGVAGGGVALLVYYFCGAVFFGWYILSGRNAARFRWVRLRAQVF